MYGIIHQIQLLDTVAPLRWKRPMHLFLSGTNLYGGPYGARFRSANDVFLVLQPRLHPLVGWYGFRHSLSNGFGLTDWR